MSTPNALPDGLTARFKLGLARNAPRAAVAIIRDRKPFVCAVSGGADSLAMLLLGAKAFPGQCHAATVDHGLRPAAADESAHVARVCRDLGVPHVTLKEPMPARAQRGANVSARARALRYCLLERHCDAIGGAAVLTAHHADDQLETLVMRLNRGAGISGLSGVRGEVGHLARPLLDWRHSELVEIVQGQGVKWIEDPSNSDDRFDRARLRKALASSELFDPLAVVQSVRFVAEADNIIERAVENAMSLAVREGDAVMLDLAAHPLEMQRRLTLRCLRLVAPDADPRQEQLEQLWQTLRAGKSATLSGVKVSPLNPVGWHFAKAPPRTVRETN